MADLLAITNTCANQASTWPCFRPLLQAVRLFVRLIGYLQSLALATECQHRIQFVPLPFCRQAKEEVSKGISGRFSEIANFSGEGFEGNAGQGATGRFTTLSCQSAKL